MKIPEGFETMDLYAVLQMSRNDPISMVRRSYLRRALQTHPDKGGSQGEFEKVSFAYSVLSDSKHKSSYDKLGRVVDLDVSLEDLFDETLKEDITQEMIDEDKKIYRESGEEITDLFELYKEYDGDFDSIIAGLVHAEVGDQDRLVEELRQGIKNGKLKKSKAFEKTTSSRAMKRRLKSSSGEAAEADETLKELLERKNSKKGSDALSLPKSSFEETMSRLEEKYAPVSKPKRRKRE